jgi:hypothetical protein
MFVSRKSLVDNFGLDEEVAKFFVDRPVPEGNLYWRRHLVYIPPIAGYIFIPIYADLMVKAGLPKERVIADEYIKLTEEIAHSSGKMEFNGMSFKEHVKESAGIMEPFNRNPELMEDIKKYFGVENKGSGKYRLGSGLDALNRADTFLFSLCYFETTDEVLKQLLELWYAIITFYLIIDDITDYAGDIEKENEENVFKEKGMTKETIMAINELFKKDAVVVKPYNAILSVQMEKAREKWMNSAQLSNYIKQ